MKVREKGMKKKVMMKVKAVLMTSIFFVLFSGSFFIHTLQASKNETYEVLSHKIKELYTAYSISPREYIVKKEDFRRTMSFFGDKFIRLKESVSGVIDSKVYFETFKIMEFFSQKMKPFADIEDMRREELLSVLREYINSFKYSPLVPYAILRYAEIYYEELSYEYIKSYEEAVLNGEPPPQKDFYPVVKIYEDFLKTYKNFPRRDAVMYLAGYVLDEMGETLKAVEKYFEPLAKIRISEFAPEAAMRCGEFWFDVGNLHRAEEFYLIVLDFPQHPLYTKALFKLAWTYYRRGEYDLAIDYFVETIEASGEEEKKTGVVKEAMDYLISSVIELGGFKKLNEERKNTILTTLSKIYSNPEVFILESEGKIYFEQGKYQEAIASYEELIDKYYLSPRSIYAVLGIFDALKKLGDINSAASLSMEIAMRWGPTSQWAKSNPSDYTHFAEKIEINLIESAKYFHDKKIYKEAEDSYLLFLELFPKSQATAEVQYLLAELYFELERYLDAYKMYETNLKNIVVKQNKYLVDAAWGMVISADKALAKGLGGASHMLKEAAFMFERLFPLDGRVPIALYKAAHVISSEGKKDEALSMLNKIVQRYPGSEVVADSILEITKIYADKGKLEEVVSFVLFSRKRKDILSDDDINYLNSLGAKALYKISKELEERKEYVNAVSKYLELMELFPDSDLLDDALYNVVMINFEQKRYWDVINYADQFLRKFPKSDLRYDVIYAKAGSLANLFFFDEAIDTYKSLVKLLDEKGEMKAEGKSGKLSDIEIDMLRESYRALLNMHIALGKSKEAAEWTLLYYERFGKDEQEPERYIRSAAELYLEAGLTAEAQRMFEEFIKIKLSKNNGNPSADIISARYKIAEVYKKEGKKKEYEDMLAKIIDEWKNLDESEKVVVRSVYSEARFYFAEKIFGDFKRVRFEKTDSQKLMAGKLKRKADLAKKIQEEMSEIVKVGDPTWSMAALFYMGYAFQEYADMLINAPIPGEIEKIRNPEEREFAIAVYREELEKRAFPLEDQAIKLFSAAVDKIKELGVRNDWTAKIFKHLKMLDPLAPVEVEDDRTVIIDIALDLKANQIPKVEPEERKTILATRNENIKPSQFTDFQSIRKYTISYIGDNIFSPIFIYQNGFITDFVF